MKPIRSLVTIALFIPLLSCSTAKVSLLPGASGENRIITTARKEHEALEASKEKAEEFCKAKNKSYAIVSQKSDYQGYDQKTKETMQAVRIGASVFQTLASSGKDRGSTYYGSGSSMDTNEDYRVEMVFRCE